MIITTVLAFEYSIFEKNNFNTYTEYMYLQTTYDVDIFCYNKIHLS